MAKSMAGEGWRQIAAHGRAGAREAAARGALACRAASDRRAVAVIGRAGLVIRCARVDRRAGSLWGIDLLGIAETGDLTKEPFCKVGIAGLWITARL